MSIKIEIFGEDARHVQAQMLQFLAGTAEVAAPTIAQPTEPAAPARRGRKPKTEEPAPEGNATGAPAESTATTQTATGSAVSATSDAPITKDSLAAKCTALISKAGPTALQELLTEFGAAKFSDLAPEKYEAANIRLDELLA